MNSKTQIYYLMKTRRQLIDRVESQKLIIARRMARIDPRDYDIFRCIYRALSVYGRSVIESVILSFESESGKQALEIPGNIDGFRSCLQKVFGRTSSKQIETTMIFEVCNEFGILVSSKTTLAEAINIARSSPKIVPDQEELERKKNDQR